MGNEESTTGDPPSTSITASPLVARVKELLPHLGEGFIEVCVCVGGGVDGCGFKFL